MPSEAIARNSRYLRQSTVRPRQPVEDPTVFRRQNIPVKNVFQYVFFLFLAEVLYKHFSEDQCLIKFLGNPVGCDVFFILEFLRSSQTSCRFEKHISVEKSILDFASSYYVSIFGR